MGDGLYRLFLVIFPFLMLPATVFADAKQYSWDEKLAAQVKELNQLDDELLGYTEYGDMSTIYDAKGYVHWVTNQFRKNPHFLALFDETEKSELVIAELERLVDEPRATYTRGIMTVTPTYQEYRAQVEVNLRRFLTTSVGRELDPKQKAELVKKCRRANDWELSRLLDRDISSLSVRTRQLHDFVAQLPIPMKSNLSERDRLESIPDLAQLVQRLQWMEHRTFDDEFGRMLEKLSQFDQRTELTEGMINQILNTYDLINGVVHRNSSTPSFLKRRFPKLFEKRVESITYLLLESRHDPQQLALVLSEVPDTRAFFHLHSARIEEIKEKWRRSMEPVFGFILERAIVTKLDEDIARRAVSLVREYGLRPQILTYSLIHLIAASPEQYSAQQALLILTDWHIELDDPFLQRMLANSIWHLNESGATQVLSILRKATDPKVRRVLSAYITHGNRNLFRECERQLTSTNDRRD